MTRIVHLNVSDRQHELIVKEFRGKRVVTFKDIDALHQRPEGTARKRFNDNKKRFIEGEDYFVRNSDEAKTEFGIVAPNGLVLLTESGYLMLVKSFTDDLAWEVQRQLVNVYFRAKDLAADLQAKQLELEQEKLKLAKSEFLLRISEKFPNLSTESHQLLAAQAAKELTGQDLLPLPKVEKTYTAGEIGAMFGKSANYVGRLANKYNLKTPEYGYYVLDKAKHNAKQVESFRYNEKGLKRLSELMQEETEKRGRSNDE
ncbi:ORF6N domain-containing protein [Thermoflavimicrobium dichotomicum]|uniref:ORF6N domain-containing protein n=1 Tax=Thermoflavimicrobium dichotomicum TaxID=46223 RepID=A0A1I3UHN6_9BACL|nr:ORF6N domain-containing protein [Thermoflavimicrobium dichotomicum]SFJ82570.1 ORF6N domain-containing protein [Thermoflavimicrobium dichotomicum]